MQSAGTRAATFALRSSSRFAALIGGCGAIGGVAAATSSLTFSQEAEDVSGEYYDAIKSQAFHLAVAQLAERVHRVELAIEKRAERNSYSKNEMFLSTLAGVSNRISAIESGLKGRVKANSEFISAVIDVADRVRKVDGGLKTRKEFHEGVADVLARIKTIEERSDEIVPRVEFYRGIQELQLHVLYLESRAQDLGHISVVRKLQAENDRLKEKIALLEARM